MDYANVILPEEERILYLLNLYLSSKGIKFSFKKEKEDGLYIHKEDGIWICNYNKEKELSFKCTNLYNLYLSLKEYYNDEIKNIGLYPMCIPRGTRVYLRKNNDFDIKDVIKGTVTNSPVSILDDDLYEVLGDDGKEYTCMWLNRNIPYIDNYSSCIEGIDGTFRTIEDYINSVNYCLTAYVATKMEGNVVNKYKVAELEEELEEAMNYIKEYVKGNRNKTK